MKLLREILGGVAYLVGMSVLSMGFAAAWRDFSVSYHLAMHHQNHAKKPKADAGCFH